jgi:hypothetical protein
MSIFEKIPNADFILISSVFYSKVWIFFNYSNSNLLHNFLSAHSFSAYSFSAVYLISTTVSEPWVNLDTAQFRLTATTASLHPPVAPPHGNQESHRVLISPSETGATHSSLLSEMKALKNFTSYRSFLLHNTISTSSSTL